MVVLLIVGQVALLVSLDFIRNESGFVGFILHPSLEQLFVPKEEHVLLEALDYFGLLQVDEQRSLVLPPQQELLEESESLFELLHPLERLLPDRLKQRVVAFRAQTLPQTQSVRQNLLNFTGLDQRPLLLDLGKDYFVIRNAIVDVFEMLVDSVLVECEQSPVNLLEKSHFVDELVDLLVVLLLQLGQDVFLRLQF